MAWISRPGDVGYDELKRQLRFLIKKYRRTCQFCFKPIPKGRATREHILPLKDGGSSDLSNLTLACFKCNLYRNNLSVEIEAVSRHIRETIERQALGLPLVGKPPLNTGSVADSWPVLISHGIYGTIRRQQLGIMLVGRPPYSVQCSNLRTRRTFNC